MSTEGRNPKTYDIDRLSTVDILKKINDEDALVAMAVRAAIDDIAIAADRITEAFRKGGKLIYSGAGTSGRMAVIDAVECYPTFGIPDGMVEAVMAGGEKAFVKALEGAEDNAELGANDIENIVTSKNDIVCGISASGNAPYVVGALKRADEFGCFTVSIVNNRDTLMEKVSKHNIFLDTGEEVIKGSTRMKAGSSQKICLNMISTCTMIKLGRVYENLMVDMKATNKKLVRRAISMVKEVCGCDEASATEALNSAEWSTKRAIVMISLGVSSSKAAEMIEKEPYLYRLI